MAQPGQDTDLDRQGFLLLAFDLLAAAVVASVIGVMLGSTVAAYVAIALAAGGLLAVVAAFEVHGRAARGPSGTSGARTAPG